MPLLALLTGLVAVVSRIAMARAAAASGKVDHYYWMLAAEAYRTQSGLPVRLDDKYLMDDANQAYPPLFGLLLGRWRLDRWGMAAVAALELAQACVLVVLLAAFHAPYAAIALAVTLYLAAAALTALVIMTHKMTLQLYLVLLLPWSWALSTMVSLLVFLVGAVIYIGIVGRGFAVYQFRAHWDIVRFWNRHWRSLGGHQFRDSPIYGTPSGDGSTFFHQPGLRGVVKHLRTVFSYAPANLLLPFVSVVTASWPPAWLLVWLGGIYLWALATLFVPRLKCLGGGHLYVFNAVAPGACYVAWLPDTRLTDLLLGLGILLTTVALVAAWHIVRRRLAARDEMFDQAVSVLAVQPKGRVAVFPLQSAEAVAWATHHAVLWGAHGYGFFRLEGFFPVLTAPLSKFLREYNIGWILSDDRFWQNGAEALRREGVCIGNETVFGHWHLTECRLPNDDRLEVSAA